MLRPIAYAVALILIAAVLRFVEGVAKLIGGRNTWLAVLALRSARSKLHVLPLQLGASVWWQRLLYPLCPRLVGALLLFAFAAINPADAVLGGGILRSAWRWSTGKNGIGRTKK